RRAERKGDVLGACGLQGARPRAGRLPLRPGLLRMAASCVGLREACARLAPARRPRRPRPPVLRPAAPLSSGASLDSPAMSGPGNALLAELGEFLRIPSVSAEARRADEVRRAGEWLCELVQRFGGACELVDWHGRPLAIGELRASDGGDRAPTVLVYGHFDVQPPEPLDLWDSPPFEPTVRDGWLCARG